MPTALDIELLPEVFALLQEFGRDATFHVQSKTYDETTGTTSYGAEPDVVAKCTPPWPYGIRFGHGDVAREGDAVIYVAGQSLGFTPVPGMSVEIDSATWSITEVGPISSGELNAAWSMRVQR